MAAAIAGQPSRFALLKIEDDDDDDGSMQSKKKQDAKKSGQQAAAKKKSKKKKKNEAERAEINELRNLAFAKGPSRKSNAGQQQNQKKKGQETEKQWEEWKKVDEGFAAETYEKDLQEALVASKIEFEHEKEFRDAVGDVLSEPRPQDGKKNKKKKKEGPKTMSLEEFNQKDSVDEQAMGDSTEGSISTHSSSTKPVKPAVTDGDTKFFDQVDRDVNKIIVKEKIQEEYRKQYVVESAQVQKYQEAISVKDQEIETLKAANGSLETELKQVKKRNKQLCHILGQGEMKEKVDVLMEVEELRQVKDELTEEVTSLTSEVEKERSKVHGLKAELDKLKSGKHGKS